MLKNPTLFVLGAGASFDFGLPLGNRLGGLIANKTNIKFQDGMRQVSGDLLIMDALRKVANENKEDVNNYLQAGRTISDGIPYTRSIDSFLHKHENETRVTLCAKLAIAQVIADHEKDSNLFIDIRKANADFRDRTTVMASWLEDFFYLLQEHVSRNNLSALLKNLMIVNFNYDRCIEHFLMHAIRKTYQKDEHAVAEILNRELKIIHPYGTLGPLPWQASSDTVPFGGHENPHREYLLMMAKGIRTFNEEMRDNEAVSTVRGMVNNAKRVCFLGFHFHEPNMKMLEIERMNAEVPVLATAYERSESSLESIRGSIANSLGLANEDLINLNRSLDCKKFFAEHADVISA